MNPVRLVFAAFYGFLSIAFMRMSFRRSIKPWGLFYALASGVASGFAITVVLSP